MDKIRNLFRRQLWLAFLIHQALIFLLAVGFINLVRSISGRTIHGGRDAVGLIDGAALVLLSLGVIVFTIFFYRWIKVDEAQPLGIKISRRRFIELILGLLAGFVFTFFPFLIALLSGTMFVRDRISAHFDNFQAFQIVAVGFFLLFVQSVMEETANRAFPLRLWEKRPLVFRLIVPSLFFALIHLADENFSYERLAVLFAGGIIQSFAYLLTGNIWFTSGIHTGANFATFSASGLWHAGAIVALVGQPAYPNWLAVVSMFLFLAILFLISRRNSRDSKKTSLPEINLQL